MDNGFIKAIILIIIALIVLGYFGFDVNDIINSSAVKDKLLYVWSIVKGIWEYLISFV